MCVYSVIRHSFERFSLQLLSIDDIDERPSFAQKFFSECLMLIKVCLSIEISPGIKATNYAPLFEHNVRGGMENSKGNFDTNIHCWKTETGMLYS